MDPRTSAQDVMRCDLCETAVVQMHCNTCLVNLCKACVGEHISTDESKDHKVVKFQARKSTPLHPGCKIHAENSCELHCKECDIPVCAACIVSKKHKEHDVHFLKDILARKKTAIQKEINELEESIYPTYLDIAADVQNTLSQLDVKYEELSIAITKHGEDWHREIDKLVKKLKSEVEEMKNKDNETLKTHLSNVETCTSKINEDVDSLRKSIDSYDVNKILNLQIDLKKYRILPSKLNVSTAQFSPLAIQEQISELFGKIIPTTISADKHGYTMRTAQGSLETSSCPLMEKASEAGSSPPIKQLLDEPETVTTINTGYRELYSVACQSDEEIWTSGNDGIKLFSISRGSLLQSLSTTSECILNNIAVTKRGDLVYANYFSKTVNIVKKQKTEVIRFKNWNPLTVCTTSSADILVVIEKGEDDTKVVRYSGATEKQTIQFDNKGKPLYSPRGLFKHITENRNLDICVADNGFHAIVVVNMTGKLRFRYTGHTLAQTNLLSPRGITTDSQSHILTADNESNCIHIIDQDGQFLRYIDCGLSEPWGLCIDTNDNLFVAEMQSNQVKKIRYKK
ncbi:E3 ubiquitin-protein ligase TRIM71-like [Saccostrea echinata]|uniref:E3 ubiquitin-protein ligase TRIM71-like n=1 Tax=Saccostrea echinata TaxID=191078 RepID=UPI002A808CFA|nr:E3 ubiquitin-protein ligase TRIM71-like [Saccostrea echinata]